MMAAVPASVPPPRALLFDYGGTLVDEVGFDTHAATAWLLRQADLAEGISVDDVGARARRVAREVSDRRDTFHIETPWVSLTRLIHDALGTRFRRPIEDLELGFWDAGVETRPMPGVHDALATFRRLGIPMGVVSNSSFRQHVIRHELSRHGLATYLDVIIVSAEYVVRKPLPMGLEVAAAALGASCADTWLVGDRLDTDVAAATAAGITPVLLAPRGVTDGAPPLTFTTWAEIAALVRRVIS